MYDAVTHAQRYMCAPACARMRMRGCDGGLCPSLAVQGCSGAGGLLKTMEGHTDLVLSTAWSPNGRLIASAGADGTLPLWGENGYLLKTLKGHAESAGDAAEPQGIPTLHRL